MKKVFSTRILPKEASLLLKKEGWDLREYQSNKTCPSNIIVQEAKDCDALICMIAEKIDAPLIDQLPNLKIISNYAVGYDNIDVDYATSKKILVGNTPDVLTESTAELALALMLSWSKNILGENQRIKDGGWKEWNPLEHLGIELNGKKVGILGMGRIGQCFAKKCALGLDMEVLTCSDKNVDFPVTKLSKDELIKQSDVISLHMPLNPQTHQHIDKEVFKAMKPSAFLINTARGKVINQQHLIEAINDGEIAGAALDVTDPEPLPPHHPLLKNPKILVTPHIGSQTNQARTQMGLLAAKNVVHSLNSRHLGHFVNVNKLT